MSDLPIDDKKRLARVAQRQWGIPRTTPVDTIDAVLTELRAMGYTLSKRIPVEGKVPRIIGKQDEPV